MRKIAALAASLALLSTGLVSIGPALDQQARVTTNSMTQTQQAPSPIVGINETEKERYERLKGLTPRRRIFGVRHRSAGDRAHKRWKQRRRAA